MNPEVMNQMIGVGGIIAGMLAAIITVIVSRSRLKKRYELDERYTYCITKSKAFSWNATTVTLAVAWIVAMVMEGVSLSFFIITGIFVVHCLSSIGANLYYSARN